MAGVSPSDRIRYTVACGCGASISLDAREFGRPRNCRSCGGAVTVGWRKDPHTLRSVPFAVTRARARLGVRADQTPYVALCGCGYRRPVSESAVGSTPRCPGCGKLMTVEKLAHLNDPSKLAGPARPDPMATVPLHQRPPVPIRVPLGATFVDCPCGERLLLRAGSDRVRQIRCPACDRRLALEFQELRRSAPPAPAPKPARVAPPPERVLRPGECACPCGAVIPPRTSRTGKTFTCAACGRKGRVEMTAGAPGLRAVVTEEPPAPAVPAPPPAVEEPPSLGEPAAPLPEEEVGLAIPVDAQPVKCECGSELFVSPSDAGRHIQCPTCEVLMAVERVDAPGGAPALRVRSVGRMDQDTWTLDDFQ